MQSKILSTSQDYVKKDMLEKLQEEWDKENKREGLELINVPDLTSKVLKICNLVRDKSINNRKILKKRTGVAAGARNGMASCNQPLMESCLRRRAKSVNTIKNTGRLNNSVEQSLIEAENQIERERVMQL